MPIYAYRCEACGFAKDVLQKIADAPLSVCPSCDKPAFKKQLTAAGFQLKGSGWYVTDFRGGSTPASAPSGDKAASGDNAASGEAKSGATDTNTSTKGASADANASSSNAKASGSDAKSTTT